MPSSALRFTTPGEAGSALSTADGAASQLSATSGIQAGPSDASGISTTIWNAGSSIPGVSNPAGIGFGGAVLPSRQTANADSGAAATHTTQSASLGADGQEQGTEVTQPDTNTEASLFSHQEPAVATLCSAALTKAGCKTCVASNECGVCGGTTCSVGETCTGGKCQIIFLTCNPTQRKQARASRAACSAG